MVCYGPFVNAVLLNLVHYFMPVFYGEYELYNPTIGSPREYLETRVTVSVESNVLLRIPFQATTSETLLSV